MIPTGTDVLAEARAWLDNDTGSKFTDVVLNRAFRSAYETMITWALNLQLPKLKNIVLYTLPVGTSSLTPADLGIANFGELDLLEERLSGSTDRFLRVMPKERLSQRGPIEMLGEFVWTQDTMNFIASSTARQLRITLFQTATAPDLTTVGGKATSLGWDGSLNFLGKMTAANAAPRKGYDIDAKRLREEARGPDSVWNSGSVGGDLWTLLNHRLVNEQKVQVAPMPYSVMRRRARRQAPYVAAQGGSVGSRFIFSTELGNITGTMNGVNPTFYLAFPVADIELFRNGNRLTAPVDYTHGANVITFIGDQIPVSGDVISANGWQ